MKEIMVETSARHIHLTDEAVETLFGKGYVLTRYHAHLSARPSAVGHAPGVAEVYYIFIRQNSSKLSNGRKAAETGVEHADGSVVHCTLSP